MPEATLGALVFVSAIGLLNISEFRRLRKLPGDEFWWAVIAFGGVAFVGTLQGIIVAVIISLADLIRYASDPPIREIGRKAGTDVFRPLADHPEDETIDGLLMLRPEGLLFFGNASVARERVRSLARERRPEILILEFSAVPRIEYTGLKELTELEEELGESGVILWLAALNPVAFEVVEQSSLGATLGHERMFFNIQGAIDHYIKRHDIE